MYRLLRQARESRSPLPLGILISISLLFTLTGCATYSTSPGPVVGASYELNAPYPCTERSTENPFICEPQEIAPPPGENVDTCFRIEMKSWVKRDITGTEDRRSLVPCFEGCTAEDAIALRTYGVPRDGGTDCSSAALEDYYWSIPGPTLHLLHPKAEDSGGKGQGIGIKLVNRLPEAPHGCQGGGELPNCFHGENTTNLHFHGTRVSPKEPQDYVFLKLKPDEDFQYRVDPITELQPPGTQWYHPHKHGSTAIQVANGMAGALVVEGYVDDDVRHELGLIRKQVFMIQQIFPNLDYFPDPGQDGRPSRPDRSLWVNGMQRPIIVAKPGEIQWWRMVAAMQQTSSQMVLQFPVAARQLAQDGVPFSGRNYRDQPLDLSAVNALFSTALYEYALSEDRDYVGDLSDGPGITPIIHFAAGNRADILVKAPPEQEWPPGCQGDEYCDFEIRSVQIADLHDGADLEDASNGFLTLRVLKGTNVGHRFPTMPKRPDYLRLEDVTDEEVGDRKELVVFSADGRGGPPAPNFCIDGKQYQSEIIDQCLEVGTAAQWRLENRAPEDVTLIAHPFHIHTNPFQLVSANGVEKPKRVWFDTFALPVDGEPDGEYPNITIRHRFVRFDGEYVLHCHILGHEDRGMMQNVRAFLPGETCTEGPKKFCSTCPCD